MTHSDSIERRASQIYGWLMRMRRRRERGTDCFIIFDEHRPGEPRGEPPPGMEFADELRAGEACEARRVVRDSFNHYLQFAFDEGDFRIDLPNETMHPAEAERLISEREGFFFLRDVQKLSADSHALNPLQKVYAYGQERAATDDVIFVLFDLWNVPHNFRWYVKAASFHGDERWEWGVPLA